VAPGVDASRILLLRGAGWRAFTITIRGEPICCRRAYRAYWENRLCFLLSRVLERFELSELERVYSEERHPAYHPLLMLKVWLHA
jgi:hypothetical protein